MEEGAQPQPQHVVSLEVDGGEVPSVPSVASAVNNLLVSGTNCKKAKGAAKAQGMVPLPIHVQKPDGSETVVAQTKTV